MSMLLGLIRHTVPGQRHRHKMATFKQIAFLLTLPFYCTSLSFAELIGLIRVEEGEDVHFPVISKGNETHFLYRSLGDKRMLLMNVTGEETASQSQRISYSASEDTAAFTLTNLCHADAGLYTVETWGEKYLIEKTLYELIIYSQTSAREQTVQTSVKLEKKREIFYLKLPQLAWPEKRVILPCDVDVTHKGKVEWETPAKHLSADPSVNIIHSKGQEEGMYIETRNYSLVIPSVKSNDSGFYKCKIANVQITSQLSVCLVLEPTYVMFSQNESVVLICDSNLTAQYQMTQWYRQRGKEVDNLDVSSSQNSLIISNLSPNERGMYRCLQKDPNLPCTSRAFHLVYRRPFGIDSPFYRVYASLMGTGLMAMICAVVYVNRKNRGGRVCQKTLKGTGEPPGRPEREGEQGGDGVERTQASDHVPSPLSISSH